MAATLVQMLAQGCLAVLLVGCAVCRGGEILVADAAERNDEAAVRALVTQGTDPAAAQADGMTALHWAAFHDNAALVHWLLARAASPKAANRYGVTPLAVACTNGNGEIAEALLQAGADPHAALAGGETPLMIAARTGRPGPVKALLARGAACDASERRGQTALMWAAADGHAEVVEILLAAGADPSLSLPSGFNALFFAVRHGCGDVVRRLLERGADVNQTLSPRRGAQPPGGRPSNALLLAVENGHFELAAALLDAGARPDDSPAGYTALHAITWVRKPIRGDGDPPPQGSGRLSSLDLVRRLAARGADLDARLTRGESGRGRFTTTGSTPFLLAARAGDVPLMRLLVELRANVELANKDGCSPLLAAAGVGALGDGDEAAATEEEALAAVRLLLDLGANINQVDHNGETAMHGAAYQSWAQVAQLLADRGAAIGVWHRQNKWGWTPLMIARGYRPGNFRPAPETIATIEKIMRAGGVEPTDEVPATAGPIYQD